MIKFMKFQIRMTKLDHTLPQLILLTPWMYSHDFEYLILCSELSYNLLTYDRHMEFSDGIHGNHVNILFFAKNLDDKGQMAFLKYSYLCRSIDI